MISLAIQVVNNSLDLAFILTLLTFTYDFKFRSALLKTLISFSPVCSSLQQMYFYFERFHFCLCSLRLVVVERWIDPWFPAQIYLRHKMKFQSSLPVQALAIYVFITVNRLAIFDLWDKISLFWDLMFTCWFCLRCWKCVQLSRLITSPSYLLEVTFEMTRVSLSLGYVDDPCSWSTFFRFVGLVN